MADRALNRSVLQTNDHAQIRRRFERLLQIHGYTFHPESSLLLTDHYLNSDYESIEDFISKLSSVILLESNSGDDIDPNTARLAIRSLSNSLRQRETRTTTPTNTTRDSAPNLGPLVCRLINVDCSNVIGLRELYFSPAQQPADLIDFINRPKLKTDFRDHFSFLFKRLSSNPVFSGDFKLTQTDTLCGSSQPSIKCICLGLLVKDVSKIDRYLLIDNKSRVPLCLRPETSYKNRLFYSNCIVLVEGVYINPDDVLLAANIGLPPMLLDPIKPKSLAFSDKDMIVILKEPYLDDDDVVKALDMLFDGYNSLEDPPVLFILIGNFTRDRCSRNGMKIHTKKLIKILRACENLRSSHFVFVPGSYDTTPDIDKESGTGSISVMPKIPLCEEQFDIGKLEKSGFKNVLLATNPAHIKIGDRTISVVSHSYIKELHKNLLYDMSDHREELFETIKRIILANGHLSAGINTAYEEPMKLWNRPDLLVLADSGAFGNRYDYSSSKSDDTSFMTVPSFARQSNHFKVYYLNSGDIEDSQVSSDALQEVLKFDEVSGDSSVETKSDRRELTGEAEITLDD